MSRRSDRRAIKKKKSKPSKKFGLVQITLAALVIFGLVFISVRPNFNNDTKKPPPKSSSIPFTKEGELSFHKSEINQTITTIDLEIADNEYERARGLMDRYSMKDNRGMLFIMDREEPQSFWMKNTYISLDIIFLDNNMKIVSIQKYTQPQSTYQILSGEDSKFIVEVIAGFCDLNNVEVGDYITYRRN